MTLGCIFEFCFKEVEVMFCAYKVFITFYPVFNTIDMINFMVIKNKKDFLFDMANKLF